MARVIRRKGLRIPAGGPINTAMIIERFAGKCLKSKNTVLKAAAIDLFTNIIEDSPVDTRRFKSNWLLTTNAPALTNQLDYDRDSVSIMKTVITGVPRVNNLYLVNNVSYSVKLEFGHSRQAPVGMVRMNVRRWPALLKSAIRRLL